MTRQTTDEEVNRWRITPRPFEADPEDALTRLAQDFHAAKRVADDAWRVHAENDRLRADNLRLRNERDGAYRLIYANVDPMDMAPEFEEIQAKAVATVEAALKRPSPGTDT